MVWVIRRFAWSLVFLATLVGVVTLRSAINGVPSELGAAAKLVAGYPEYFLIGILALLILRDFSPILRQRLGIPLSLRENWQPRSPERLYILKRLIFPVTFEPHQILQMNARPNTNAVDFSVFAVSLAGRNNSSRPISISGRLEVEHRPEVIPLFFHARNQNRTVDGMATINGHEAFVAYASLVSPRDGQLICDNSISDALFLRDYAPFVLVVEYGGKKWRRRFSYSRIRSEIDHERDRVLFYDMHKHV